MRIHSIFLLPFSVVGWLYCFIDCIVGWLYCYTGGTIFLWWCNFFSGKERILKSKLLITCGLLLMFGGLLLGQTVQLERWEPVVTQNGQTSFLGFAGGLNSPQFSAVDLNRDGQQDFFVFDRVGNAPLAFVRVGDGSFRLQNHLLKHFPPLDSWVLLRDYNQDGAMDIFAYNDVGASGVQVYRGYYGSDDLLHFERIPFGNDLNIIPIPTSSGGETQLYISNIDYPAVQDIDCDGDLDILTFNIGGGYLEFYQNRSLENGFGLDSLQFILADDCYGGIYESGLSEFLSLASAVGECAAGEPDPQESEDVIFRHVGSTILLFDNDGDADLDLVLGDLSFPYLNLSTNANNCEQAWMNDQDAYFPSYDFSVELPIFPAAYYLDINGDGRRDLIAAPNPTSNGVDHENVWYYENNGTDTHPDFALQQDDLLVGEMIDMGTRSHPAILDYDADGLMDIVVGNQSFYELFGAKNTRLHLYRNVGTATVPAFELVDDDFLDMAQFSQGLDGIGTFGLAPTFGDLDGDGDQDAIVGEIGGTLFFVENTAGSGQPVSFAAPVLSYADIDIGQSATPQIIDLNRDGLQDLVIGEKNGNINYFQNVGSVGNPVFGNDETVPPNVKNLGDVDTRMPGFSTGYAAPWFVDLDGAYRLFVGTQFGDIEVYDGIESNLNGEPFVRLDDIPGLTEGEHLQVRMLDWNNDGHYEFLLGNERGGLSVFSSNLSLGGTVSVDEEWSPVEEVKLFPNPTTDGFWVEVPELGHWELQVFDLYGRLLLQESSSDDRRFVSLRDQPAGAYVVMIKNNTKEYVQRVVRY